MIRVENLSKHFIRQASGRWQRGKGEVVQAVKDISFCAEDGQITGLLGANGAGKTTTLRMIGALLKQDGGHILVDGVAVQAGQQATQAQMGVLSDARGLYPRLSARENIVYYGVLHGMSREQAHQRVDVLAEVLELKPILERRCDGFSQGEKMKTALARALVHDPKNIILDEPTNGLDVLATRALREFLRWLRSPAGGSKCIIFSTHIMQEVERLCDHVVVVAHGKTVAQGSVAALLSQVGATDFEDAFVKLAFDQSAEPSIQTRSAA
ncbi:ATP-binding cassette domain-containing protein [Solimicrobium silvestre]|uniref:ABC-type Na+ transport system ATPase component n=1 Tax=Solimicrobium silvestre TaxID=2099400 RepID=A0A2S9H1G2_9BURK|nr:ATP-binding cassette domain-containing protein [Solimicrobium silvestre]PRC93790.1 ABC-type Na+ transport system ATPase component [Solimicrobium silvestre]